MENNRGTIRGKLKSPLVKEYEFRGEVFYSGVLLARRLSSIEDEIPIIVPDKYFNKFNEEVVTVEGSFRSRNNVIEGKSSLQLYLFVENVDDTYTYSDNTLILEGYVCKEPNYRITPLNRNICDVLIAVNRSNHKSDYIPCIVWGRNARWAKDLKIGDKVKIVGRIQSRKFSKQGDIELLTRTAYEVSVNSITLLEDSYNKQLNELN